MSCGTPCSPSNPVVQVGPAIATNVPSGQCSSTGYCDDKLEGLPRRPGIDLVGVVPGGKCLVRALAAAGIWQHDPTRPSGTDFVGPLARMEILDGEVGEYGHLPVMVPELKDYGDGIKQPITTVRPSVPGDYNDGQIGLIRRQVCPDGTALLRPDKLEPAAWPGTTPANFWLFGFEEGEDKCGGSGFPTRRFYKSKTLILRADALTGHENVNLDDAATYLRPVFKKSGDRVELGVISSEAEAETPAGALLFYPRTSPALIYQSGTQAIPTGGPASNTIVAPDYPAAAVGQVWGLFTIDFYIASGDGASVNVSLNAEIVAALGDNSGAGENQYQQFMIPMTGQNVALIVTRSSPSGTGTYTLTIKFNGYFK